MINFRPVYKIFQSPGQADCLIDNCDFLGRQDISDHSAVINPNVKATLVSQVFHHVDYDSIPEAHISDNAILVTHVGPFQ